MLRIEDATVQRDLSQLELTRVKARDSVIRGAGARSVTVPAFHHNRVSELRLQAGYGYEMVATVKQLITGDVLSAGRLAGAPADVLIDGDTIVAVLSGGRTSPRTRAASTPRTACSCRAWSTPILTPRSISAKDWRIAGRSNCCSTPIPGPRAGARWSPSIFPPLSARSRWCAKAAPPVTT